MKSEPKESMMDRLDWSTDLPVSPRAPVGVVIVSFNTMALTAQTIYSLYSKVHQPAFHLVVVDNASTDGSVEMLRAVSSAGLCDVILNSEQRYHGPALNQGIDYLAVRQASVPETDRIGYVWILDSDCFVIRDDVLSAAADLMRSTRAGLVGQWAFDAWHDGEMMGLHCLLIDPAQVWQPSISRFDEGGSPSESLHRTAWQAGIHGTDFPFTRNGYTVHLGRSTLRSVVQQQDRENRYFEWAISHNEPHFMDEPEAPALYAAFLTHFSNDVPDPSAASLIAACQRHRTWRNSQ